MVAKLSSVEDHATRILGDLVPLPMAMPMSAVLIAGRR